MAGNIITAGLAYDPYFYANATLEQLNKQLAMAMYVNRQYETEKGYAPGSIIQLRRPGKVAAQNMPIALASASDLEPEYQSIALDQWQGTLFKLTDKELTYTREKMITEHLAPCAIGIADKIEQVLAAKILDVPWTVEDDSSTPSNDFPALRKVLFDNLAPRSGTDWAYMIDSVLQARYESLALFQQVNTAGSDALQVQGFIGKKFGFNIFGSQNAPVCAAGTLSATDPTVNGAFAKGVTQISLNKATLTGSLKKGNFISIAGDTQKYAITADATASGNAITVNISPMLKKATAGGEAVTVDQTASTSIGAAFHRNAFALVMAPLAAPVDPGLGVKVATVSDPITGLVLRSRIFYDGGTAATYVGVDALFAVSTLNPNLAARLRI